MNTRLRPRFWVEAALATAAGLLTVLTVTWHDWLEIVFGWDPDHHSGSLEMVLAAGLLVLAVAFSIAVRHEWRRAQHAAARGSGG